MSTTESLLNQGFQARREHRHQDAKAAYTEAVAQSRQASESGILAQSLKRLGGIERDLGNTAAALELYHPA
jgi:hypothetical protein